MKQNKVKYGKHSVEHKKQVMSILFMMPAVLVSFILIIYPIIKTITLSFQDVKFFGSLTTEASFTLKNFKAILSSPTFWNAFKTTILYTLVVVLSAYIIGLITALLLNKDFFGRKFARTLILLAWPIPGVVVSILVIWMFDSNFGIINNILMKFHLISENIQWINSKETAFLTVCVATIWKSYPFFTLMFLAGLQTIPKQLHEAIQIDGGNKIQEFFYITFPALRQITAISLLLNGLWIFRNFDLIYVITGGGPARSTETLPIQLYQEAFNYFNMGKASAIGIFSLIICILMVLVFLPSLKKEFY